MVQSLSAEKNDQGCAISTPYTSCGHGKVREGRKEVVSVELGLNIRLFGRIPKAAILIIY